MRDIKLTESKIKERIRTLNHKHSSHKDYVDFFTKAQEKLINHLNNINNPTWLDIYDRTKADTDAEKVFKQRYVKNDNKNQNLILDRQHNVIGKAKISLENTLQSKENVQGDKNPINRTILKKIVNFDSHYREILRPYSYVCFDGSPDNNSQIVNSEKRLYRSSNYTVSLTKPLSNIVDLTVDSVEIPNSWYVFSKDYGTNLFQIFWWDKEFGVNRPGDSETNEVIIQIEDGNYTQQQLMDIINQKIQSENGAPDIVFEYFSYNNKVKVTNNEIDNNVKICWYVVGSNIVDASYGGGSRIDYNLGWLMGWRVSSIFLLNTSQSIDDNIDKNKSICDAQIDIYGPKYFIVTLDDFNNNKPNQDLISLEEGGSISFKLPEYYNTQTMDRRYAIGNDGQPKYYPGYTSEEYKCADIADVNNNKRGCSNTALNKDLVTNLTQAQVYTYEQIQLANSSKGVIRYNAPSPSDLLVRIPINRDPQNWSSNIFYKNDNPEYNKRIYFGPVKIRKFNVKLLNDKGFEVNLNGKDWSFSVILSQLYQF
tara:strand:- start:3453 stop:5066 length:1614 start_codon:yes stop_codon:yes gene_type:complete